MNEIFREKLKSKIYTTQYVNMTLKPNLEVDRLTLAKKNASLAIRKTQFKFEDRYPFKLDTKDLNDFSPKTKQ